MDWTHWLICEYMMHGDIYPRYDCYSFCRAITREIYGYDLPEYRQSGIFAGVRGLHLAPDLAAKGGLKKLDAPTEGCFVRMKDQSGLACHCGIYIGDGKIIHLDQRGARIERGDYRIIDYWGIK
jgi:cell wall-associated NlpC family hydrolase